MINIYGGSSIYKRHPVFRKEARLSWNMGKRYTDICLLVNCIEWKRFHVMHSPSEPHGRRTELKGLLHAANKMSAIWDMTFGWKNLFQRRPMSSKTY